MIRLQTGFKIFPYTTLFRSDARTQAELASTVWAATGKSWYKTEKGRITNNWSGSTVRYWWITRRFDREHYRARARERVAYPATAPADALEAGPAPEAAGSAA